MHAHTNITPPPLPHPTPTPKRTFAAMHDINGRLFDQDTDGYSRSAYRAVDRSLVALEASITTLHEEEQVRAIWEWLESIGKENPTFASAIGRSLVESLPMYKWTKTIMDSAPPLDNDGQGGSAGKGGSSAGGPGSERGGFSGLFSDDGDDAYGADAFPSPPPSSASSSTFSASASASASSASENPADGWAQGGGFSEEEHEALCAELLKTARPEIRDRVLANFHILLVPRVGGGGGGRRGTKGGGEGGRPN